MISPTRIVAVVLCVGSLLTTADLQAQETPSPSRKVVKSDQEWSRVLTPDQFAVTRRKATEPAFSGKYAESHGKGTYACVCCGAPLFASSTKFNSGTGWPSFYKPVDERRIETAADYLMGTPRIEVMCADCGAHLGHVFDDGPAPTGLRFCINSVALKLVPPASTTKTKDKDKSKDKDKAKDKSTDKDKSTTTETTGSTTDDAKTDSTKNAKSTDNPR